MSMLDLKAAFKIIEQYKEHADFEGEKPAEMVDWAERTLCLTFPPTYRKFLERLGCGDIGGFEFYGVIKTDIEGSSIPDVVWITLEERRQSDLPKEMIIIAESGVGGWFVLDTSKRDGEGECPVVELFSEVAEPQVIASDFGEFFFSNLRTATIDL